MIYLLPSDPALSAPVRGDSGQLLGQWLGGNPLDPAWSPAPSGRTIAWSGTIAPGLFDADIRTWGPLGQGAFARRCDELARAMVPGAGLALRPHARHVLGDTHRCGQFLTRRAGEGFGLLLDPVSMLTGAMLRDWEDHMTRALATLAPHPGVIGVVVCGAEAPAGEQADHDDGPALALCSLGQGVIDAGAMLKLIERWVPASVPVVLLDRDVERQRELLGSIGRG